MTDPKLAALCLRLEGLCVLRPLLADPVVSALIQYLRLRQTGEREKAVWAYGEFVFRLYDTREGNLSQYLLTQVCQTENVYVRHLGRGRTPEKHIAACLEEELSLLQQVAQLTPEELTQGLPDPLPGFACPAVDLVEEYHRRMRQIGRYGYGIFAAYHMFYVDGANHIVPVRNPDDTRLEDLVDYAREKKIILDNTYALLAGKPAANMLLSGDAGTGKSSTVKAVVNALYPQGLRIVEVRKEQLHAIPALLDDLTDNPLKFILFIDDLSFAKNDDNYSALKAILEGSVSAKSQNVVIYATSNRRHLVKESFREREGDDIHFNDTLQETVSLSERFGLQVTFQKPDKQTYLHIVHCLAKEYGVALPFADLEAGAERFALTRCGRSARTAKQYVENLASSMDSDQNAPKADS